MIHKIEMVLLSVGISACCSVPPLPSPPEWVTVAAPSPTGSACSAYSGICNMELEKLQAKLRSQMSCCETDATCRSELITVGSALWNEALGVHALVHINAVTVDKELALSELHQKIASLSVCRLVH